MAATTVDARTREVLDPVGPVRTIRHERAPRLRTLAGARIGILENSKPNADVLIGGAVDHLVEQGAQLVRHSTKPGPASPAPYDWYEAFAAECDAVLTGSGDCGSCTSWSVYDSIELERRGVPVVLMATDEFRPLAESERETLGLPQLGIALVPYPTGGVDPEQTRAKGRAAGPRVAALLLGQATGTAA
ncbi:hypothetical protein [Conexibacter sp. CPCC 206217]|uniref:UGSC family (seleno)protein n=1 Tax=Conexibacter sp. CPCC 206217 TaxID=3064574 RepID=UPI002728BA20|nr:hypothetical protein [Conexibacter sp. CPCC 206217]MDO8208874.1 hypothetical protein [Conexibacter sp. CPCC 206217]